jgi:CP family cyanate transporter-like MFS transporter
MPTESSPEALLDGAVETTVDRRTALVPTALLMAAILLVAGNLRPVVTSIGPVLDEVRTALRASAGWASVLTAVPGLCFGLAGFLAPVTARRLGLARAIGLAMVLVTIGSLARVLDGSAVMLTGTLVACAGIAVCNVLLPVVVKESYPRRIGLITGLYTAVLQGAAALGSLATPLVADAAGGWRIGLGEWALLAAVGTVGWMLAARHGRATQVAAAAPAEPRRSLLRNRLAWAVTVFFGLQSMFAYVMMGWAPQVLIAAGVSRAEAGAMTAVMSLIGVPLSLVIAPLAARQRSQSPWLVGISAVAVIGLVGLLVAPAALPWVWAVTLGIGMGVFPIAVTIISLRTRTPADTRQLSTMSQGIGYLLAAVGPLLFGILHGVTGGWTASLAIVLAGVGVQLVVGAFAGRHRYV